MKRKNPLLEQQLYRIRDPKTGSAEFRSALERIGEFLGYQIAEELETEERDITTCLGKLATHKLIKASPTLITILRAGLPFYNGLQTAFPEAESGFIGAMRDEKTLKSKISYLALPELKGKNIILADTMLATGGSFIDSIKILKKQEPRSIIIAAVISSKQGIEKIRAYNPALKVYTAAIDPKLNEKGYIVPGLGDAGDRCYGRKI